MASPAKDEIFHVALAVGNGLSNVADAIKAGAPRSWDGSLNFTGVCILCATICGTVVATKFWLNRLEAWEKKD